MARARLMSDEEFRKFFDDLANAAVEGTRSELSLAEVLEKNGISMDLPEPVSSQVMPLLKVKPGEVRSIPHNCKPCGACGICAMCGEINAAAIGAAAASIWHILD